MKILITDGDNRASLAAVRSLGKCGYEVYIADKSFPCLASSSKYCRGEILHPDPLLQPDDFSRTLSQEARKLKISIIIPVSDITTFLISKNKDILFDDFTIPIADYQQILKAANKHYITNFAHSIGIPIPASISINSVSELDLNIQRITYPCVIKPSQSRIQNGNEWIFTSVSYANNENELREILSKKVPAEFPVLLQERISGPGVGVFMCFKNSEVIAQFSHKRLREKPPSGGVSVLRESIPVDSRAAEYSAKLLKHLNWNGVAMIEFKQDNRDGTLKLMEINGRLWGSLQLAIDSGVDFPRILVENSMNITTRPQLNYRIGIKSRWLLGDLDALLMYLFKSKKMLHLPDHFEGKVTYLLKFMQFWQKDTYYEILKLEDIKPWLYELKKWLLGK